MSYIDEFPNLSIVTLQKEIMNENKDSFIYNVLT